MTNLPKYNDLFLPTLKAIDALGGSASIEEIQDKVVSTENFPTSQMEAAYPKSGALVMPDRLSWARSHLKIAGMLASGGKGIWVLTDIGREALGLSPAQIKKRVTELSAAHHAVIVARRAQAKAGGGTLEDVSPDDDGDGEADWSDQLLAKLQSIEPAAFERLCQRLLREHGFTKVEVTGKSGDGGIDGQGVLRVNLVSFHVYFQCKRYKGSVSSGTIRDFRGAMQGRGDKGLVITTGSFTADARKEATRDGAPAIDLIDGELLCELLKEKRLGVAVREVRTEVVSVDAAFFEGV